MNRKAEIIITSLLAVSIAALLIVLAPAILSTLTALVSIHTQQTPCSPNCGIGYICNSNADCTSQFCNWIGQYGYGYGGPLGHCDAAPQVCGNGAVEGTEQCDDGNNDDGDGCSSICTTEDADGDGIPDDIDNCPTVYNPGQEDTDGTPAISGTPVTFTKPDYADPSATNDCITADVCLSRGNQGLLCNVAAGDNCVDGNTDPNAWNNPTGIRWCNSNCADAVANSCGFDTPVLMAGPYNLISVPLCMKIGSDYYDVILNSWTRGDGGGNSGGGGFSYTRTQFISPAIPPDGIGDACAATAPIITHRREAVIETYNLDEISDYINFEGASLDLSKDSVVDVTINGEKHKITILEINYADNTVTVLIQSTPVEITLSAGETKKVDTNNDGIYELEITFAGITAKGVNLEFTKLAACGNRICETGESQASCCADCGCPANNECKNNICALITPSTPPAQPKAQPPTLPAYIRSSVLRDIAKGFAYFIVITAVIAAIIAFLISKKIIRIKKERAIFWNY